jgi:hypothetical protein
MLTQYRKEAFALLMQRMAAADLGQIGSGDSE